MPPLQTVEPYAKGGGTGSQLTRNRKTTIQVRADGPFSETRNIEPRLRMRVKSQDIVFSLAA